MHRFGCEVWAPCNPLDSLRKLDDRRRKYVFLGYSNTVPNGYLLGTYVSDRRAKCGYSWQHFDVRRQDCVFYEDRMITNIETLIPKEVSVIECLGSSGPSVDFNPVSLAGQPSDQVTDFK